MPENSGDRSTPLPDNIKQKPADPNKRNLLKATLIGIGSLVGLKVGLMGAEQMANNKLVQDLVKSAPGQSRPDRPSTYRQMEEIDRDLKTRERSIQNSTVDPTQQTIQTEYKATMDANPNNKNQTSLISTPTPKK